MMKKLLCALVALALLMSAACGVGESLFVDNRETDKVYPERLNLRAQPTKNGAILGLYYTGTEVNVLAVENEEYDKVEVGGVTGYMASAYLIPQEEIAARYGEDSGFGDGRAAEIDLNGMWMTSVPLRETTVTQARRWRRLTKTAKSAAGHSGHMGLHLGRDRRRAQAGLCAAGCADRRGRAESEHYFQREDG